MQWNRLRGNLRGRYYRYLYYVSISLGLHPSSVPPFTAKASGIPIPRRRDCTPVLSVVPALPGTRGIRSL